MDQRQMADGVRLKVCKVHKEIVVLMERMEVMVKLQHYLHQVDPQDQQVHKEKQVQQVQLDHKDQQVHQVAVVDHKVQQEQMVHKDQRDLKAKPELREVLALHVYQPGH
jgi:ABC-type uncharacterized transport system substrate-binding protein